MKAENLATIVAAIEKRFTRKQIAHRLGCSIGQVQRFELAGRLHAIKEGGRVYFSADEVAALDAWKPKRETRKSIQDRLGVEEKDTRPLSVIRAEYEGKVAQLLFPLFDKHWPHTKIIVETGIHPRLVREMYTEWKTTFEDHEKLKAAAKREAREREMQRAHDRKMRFEDWAETRIKIARERAKAGTGT